jgi:hypothetical protein
MALGLKGGFALARTGLGLTKWQVATGPGHWRLALAVAVPIAGWLLLRRLLPAFDALAVAATYGSVSAVTFLTAMHMLEQQGLPAGGHMAAAMALMEAPAIVLAVALAQRLRQRGAVALPLPGSGGSAVLGGAGAPGGGHGVAAALREALTDGGLLLLVGALAVGVLSGDAGASRSMSLFTGDLFKGLLAFFLLDMGLLTARQLPGAARPAAGCCMAYGVLAPPLLHAGAGAAAWRPAAGLGAGRRRVLLMVLAASASYIAVPAVAAPRRARGYARRCTSGLSLGLTFPLQPAAGHQWLHAGGGVGAGLIGGASLACASPATAPAKEPAATQAHTACCTMSEGKNSCSSRPFFRVRK